MKNRIANPLLKLCDAAFFRDHLVSFQMVRPRRNLIKEYLVRERVCPRSLNAIFLFAHGAGLVLHSLHFDNNAHGRAIFLDPCSEIERVAMHTFLSASKEGIIGSVVYEDSPWFSFDGDDFLVRCALVDVDAALAGPVGAVVAAKILDELLQGPVLVEEAGEGLAERGLARGTHGRHAMFRANNVSARQG